MGDIVFLGNYLTGGAVPPVLSKCDCDGFPGVNTGDMIQISAWLIYGPGQVSFYDCPGTDLLRPSYAEFFVIGEPNGVNVFDVEVVVDIPSDVYGLQLLFSFAPEPGQSDLNCTGIDFTGSVGTSLGFSIDNTGKVFAISGTSNGGTLISAGSRGLLCTATFELAGAAGDPVVVEPTASGRLSPLLFTRFYYQGVDLQRVCFPNFHHWPIGDLDCDGLANITDIVY